MVVQSRAWVLSFSLVLVAAEEIRLSEKIADAFGAKCLDGSHPTYEMTRNESSSQWMLFLEGGGWCFGPDANSTIMSCAARAGFIWPPGSSARIGTIRTIPERDSLLKQVRVRSADLGGVMSQDPNVNPSFYTWNKVFVHYCDGSSFGSSRRDPIPVSLPSGEGSRMWLRGRNNFDAVVSDLLESAGLGLATEVVLSGGSAGGLAVLYNLDHLVTLLPQRVRLTGFPDAGFFLDARSAMETYEFRQNFLGADAVWNVTGSGGTNRQCLADLEQKGEAWKCLMAPYLAAHITTPFFIMNAAYDVYQLQNILRAPCLPVPGGPSCSTRDKALLRAYRDELVSRVLAVTAHRPEVGAYIDSCYVHEQNVDYCSVQDQPNCVGWTPSEPGSRKWGYSTQVCTEDGRQLTPQQAFSAYYNGDRSSSVVIDGLLYPDNPSCHYLGHPVITPAVPSIVV